MRDACRYALNWVKIRAWEWSDDWDALLMIDADTSVVGESLGCTPSRGRDTGNVRGVGTGMLSKQSGPRCPLSAPQCAVLRESC